MIFRSTTIDSKKTMLSALAKTQTIEERIERLETTVLELLQIFETHAVGCPSISAAAEVMTSDWIGTETKKRKHRF